MTRKGPITEEDVHHLLTHKDHAVEMVKSIIKETDLDRCSNQTTEDLGASGLFDLSRVHFFQITSFMCFFVHFFADSCLDLRCWSI